MCKESKDSSDFYPFNSEKKNDGFQYNCKSCLTEYNKARYKRPGYAEKIRNRDLKRLCGIDLELFEFVLQEQGGVCRICKGPKSDKTGWHADHDHTSSKFRGVLCGNCNRGLGQFKDNAATLINAATYLSL